MSPQLFMVIYSWVDVSETYVYIKQIASSFMSSCDIQMKKVSES